MEHLREFFLRKMLLFWLFFGTFAGVFSPENVAVLLVFWNICGSFFSGKCCCFAGFLEHLRENSRRLLLNLRNYGTFAGAFSPENVAVLLVFWNICRKMRGIYFRLRLQLS
ncbi:hypothetical protein [Gardnerella sp. Marseille-Q2328]|uniref:hypothetical protein n=1 Tax=Gardnerella sp. Marseille-Q2328 TaxID=2759694 RepID=UPI0020251726|nr:hypothetical protein [Gardnerella sp. Marseille-Q2328]